jgi:hypothetical protein
MKTICSGPGELTLCGKPATKRLLTRAIFACCDEHAEIILSCEKSGLHLSPDVNPWVDCGPDINLYGIRSHHIAWCTENGGDDIVGTLEEIGTEIIKRRDKWIGYSSEEFYYKAQLYETEYKTIVTPTTKIVTPTTERLLGEAHLDLDTPVKCVRLLAGLTQGQLVDRVAAQRNCSIIDAAIIVERSEKNRGDVSIEDFMMISDACGYKVKAFLFTKD